jgi:hypothetical protein
MQDIIGRRMLQDMPAAAPAPAPLPDFVAIEQDALQLVAVGVVHLAGMCML